MAAQELVAGALATAAAAGGTSVDKVASDGTCGGVADCAANVAAATGSMELVEAAAITTGVGVEEKEEEEEDSAEAAAAEEENDDDDDEEEEEERYEEEEEEDEGADTGIAVAK